MTTSPRRNRKAPQKQGYDYTQSGVYFVTICTHERAQIFGTVVDDTMCFTELGRIANDCWLTTPHHFQYVEVDCFIVMPNHVHAIIVHNPDKGEPPNLNDTVGNRHACSLLQNNQHHNKNPKRGIFRNGRYIPPGVMSGSLGAVVGSYKSAVTKIANRTLSDPPSKLWQRFYHDHIIQDEKELDIIRQYVLTNPVRWDEDHFNE